MGAMKVISEKIATSVLFGVSNISDQGKFFFLRGMGGGGGGLVFNLGMNLALPAFLQGK